MISRKHYRRENCVLSTLTGKSKDSHSLSLVVPKDYFHMVYKCYCNSLLNIKQVPLSPAWCVTDQEVYQNQTKIITIENFQTRKLINS